MDQELPVKVSKGLRLSDWSRDKPAKARRKRDRYGPWHRNPLLMEPYAIVTIEVSQSGVAPP